MYGGAPPSQEVQCTHNVAGVYMYCVGYLNAVKHKAMWRGDCVVFPAHSENETEPVYMTMLFS